MCIRDRENVYRQGHAGAVRGCRPGCLECRADNSGRLVGPETASAVALQNASSARHRDTIYGTMSARGAECDAPGGGWRVPCGAAIDRHCTETWDFIVGCDLVYNQAGCELLPRTLAALMSERTQVLYAHTKRRFEMLDCDFLASLAAVGLRCEEVSEPWAPSPLESPPAFSSLFPEMRIVVWRISKVR